VRQHIGDPSVTAGRVEHGDGHRPGVQVDLAVETVLGDVESHRHLFLGGAEPMDYHLVGLAVVAVVAVAVLSRVIRVASEHERFAVIELGSFKGLRGPGILLKLSTRAEWLRVKLGDRGELLAPGVARLGGGELPVRAEGQISARQFVRVARFEGEGTASRIVVTLDADQRREIQCPKCGHQIELA
jgi:hypothetical protein